MRCAGPRGHILNLGHGVLVGTPEEAVAHFFEVARSLEFSTPQSHVVEEPKLVVWGVVSEILFYNLVVHFELNTLFLHFDSLISF